MSLEGLGTKQLKNTDISIKQSPLLADSRKSLVTRAMPFCRDGVLHYSTRPNSGPGQILKGNNVDQDPPIQAQDPQLLGQIDHLEAGKLTGWACSKGQLLKPLEVSLLLITSSA